MTKRKPAKRRNQADSTLRNVRAANKRIAELEKRVGALEKLHPLQLYPSTVPMASGPFAPPVGSIVD